MTMLRACTPVDRSSRPRVVSGRHRFAFTLTELLVALGLIATVALLAGKTFQTSVRTTYRMGAQQTGLAQWEHALWLLRRDVWNAQRVVVNTPTSADVRSADGSVVTWNVDDAGALHRVFAHDGKPIEQLNWAALTRGVRFDSSDDLLAVTTSGPGRADERIVLPTARALMQEGRP